MREATQCPSLDYIAPHEIEPTYPDRESLLSFHAAKKHRGTTKPMSMAVVSCRGFDVESGLVSSFKRKRLKQNRCDEKKLKIHDWIHTLPQVVNYTHSLPNLLLT